MTDFWRASGFHLLSRDGNGWLAVGDDYLRAYFGRPELRPEPSSCDRERVLYAALMEDPQRPVADAEIEALADQDARDNYRVVLAFRDRLMAAGTVEACYMGAFRDGMAGLPPLFLDQMVHVILRNLLDGCDDPIRLRAAELLFRPQKVTLGDGGIMMADEEVVAMHLERAGDDGGLGNLGRLLVEADAPVKGVELDVLSPHNADLYWRRDERHDTVLDASFGAAGLDGLCRVLERWVRHFLSIEVNIQPIAHVRDEAWAWHVGLDAEASALLNDLYDGQELGEDRLRRLLVLFRLNFANPAEMRADLAGKPVYLGLAMDGAGVVRLKPQNLLVNLPTALSA